MELEQYNDHPVTHGLVSTVIGIGITFGVHQIYPAGDITWALTAVAIASFFSGTFSAKYSGKE